MKVMIRAFAKRLDQHDRRDYSTFEYWIIALRKLVLERKGLKD